MDNFLKNKKIGAFIVPTGVGAAIGGYAGDASFWARRFSEELTLIVNPNVVNAGCFSGINEKMLYVEGYSLDEFFKGNLGLLPSKKNKVGVVLDSSISQDVLNIHINTINAVKIIYDIEIEYQVTSEPVKVDFFIDDSGISTGRVSNISTLVETAKSLQKSDCTAIAVVCKFNEDNLNQDYANGTGVDPIGGVEAIISHYLSRELMLPVAHSPAFEDYSISSDLINPKACAEYITPTFLPCILIGLSMAPALCKQGGIRVENLDYLIMPYNSLGSTPVFESLKKGVKIFAIKENKTVLNVTKEVLNFDKIIEIEDYQSCLELIKSMD